MITHYVTEQGDPIGDGKRIQVLAHKSILKIEINSLSHLSPSVIMRLLKKQYDCRSVEIEHEIVTCKVRN